MNAEEFVSLIAKLNTQEKPFSLGTIDSNYSSGKPRIQFDGESSPSGKGYPYLSSYSPTGGDRVLIANIAGTHVVLGKIQN